MSRCNDNKLYKKVGWGGGEHETLSTNEIKELELAELISHSIQKDSKQPMRACDSHNYYFIKELLQLAAALWCCCEEAGTARGGWGWTGRWVQSQEWESGGAEGVGGGHVSIWVISQSAWGWVTEQSPTSPI